MKGTKGLGQRAEKCSTQDCFPFNNCLHLKKSVEAAASIGVDLVDTVKTNNKYFQGYDRRVNEGLAWQILHSVEEQVYGASRKDAAFYWLKIKFLEGTIIC